ncbi:MAG: hypothetical protein C4290_08115 [Chloroflexota bacterium]
MYRALRDGLAMRVQTRASLLAIADAVDARDRTPGHSERVAELARRLAIHLRLPPHDVELIALAARVHDIGNLGLRSTIFTKPGPLSPVEWREVRTHTEAGAPCRSWRQRPPSCSHTMNAGTAAATHKASKERRSRSAHVLSPSPTRLTR